MKAILATIAAMFALAFTPAHAQGNGEVNTPFAFPQSACSGASGQSCYQEPHKDFFARKELSLDMNCWPIWSACSNGTHPQLGKYYEKHLVVRTGGETEHWIWKGKIVGIPSSQGDMIQWAFTSLIGGTNANCTHHQ